MGDLTYLKGAIKIEQFVEGALDDKIKAAVRTKALIGGVCMAVPLWGLETTIYAICLWGTYKKISKISGVPFRKNFVRNIISGFIVNIIITFILCMLLDFIPVVGWIGSFAVGYASLYLSAMGYVKALKVAHGDKAKSDLNLQRGMEFAKMKSNPSHSIVNATVNKAAEVEQKVDGFVKQLSDDTPLTQGVEEADVIEATPAKSATTKTQMLLELKKLLDEGILTQEEFDQQKIKILNSNADY